MSYQHIRVIVEVEHDVQFSRFKEGEKEGGVQPIDPMMIEIVKAHLQDALLHLEKLSHM